MDEKKTMKSMARIVSYLENDEREHMEEMQLDGNSTRGHVYWDVLAVKSYLQEKGAI